MAKESNLQTSIAHELRYEGWAVVRLNSATFKVGNRWVNSYHVYGMKKDSNKGMPDLLAFKDNKVLLIEVKLPNGKLRQSQERIKEFMKRHNVMYHKVTSVKDVRSILAYDII